MFQFLIANFSSQSLGFQPPKPRQVNTFEPTTITHTVENIHQFPSNLLVNIFRHADLEDLLALSAVCKKFWTLTSRNNLELWKYKVEERWKDMGVYEWLEELCKCEFPEAQLMKQRLLLPSSVDWRWMAQTLKVRIPVDGQEFTGLGFELVEKTFSFGMWKNGLLDGPGVRIHQGKHLYFGDWEAGRWNGHGTVLSSTPETGGLYIGQYKQSMSEGYGLKKWANGATYYGEWKKKRINGHGVYTWANGSEYDGSWKNNERSGIGHYKWANGSKYYGEWKRNNFEGRGTKIYENGDVYRGMWENDLQNGQGTYITSYGAKFDGIFKAGERSRGTFTHADGYSWTGTFNRNIPTEESAIHPVVRAALEKRQCTRTACPADKFYGQVLFQCVPCSSSSSSSSSGGAKDVYLCPTCAGLCGHQQNHPLEAVWTFGASRCGCTVCHPHENAAESSTTRNTSPEK